MDTALAPYEYDLFISYAHEDNEQLTEDSPGWVDFFHEKLEKVLKVRLGEKPRIWRDRRELRGNHDFDDEIIARLVGAAYLVSVVSPLYINSEWCRREVKTFVERATDKGTLRYHNQLSLFKVIKSHVDTEKVPPPLGETLGYEFFRRDEEDRPRDLIPGLFKEDDREFFRRLGRLVLELETALKQLRSKTAERVPPAPTDGATVYLAVTTHDMAEAREQIRHELEQRGHCVLPARDFIPSMVKSEFEQEARALLERCDLSLHLMGSYYGVIPEEATRSIVEIQHDLAGEVSRGTSFARLIWLPEDLEPRGSNHERLRHFVDRLEREPTVHQGDDLIRSPREEFKDVLLDKLRRREPAEETLSAPGPARIYIIGEVADFDVLDSIREYLYDEGYAPDLPLFDGQEDEILEDHRESLATCDAVLIYWGHASEAWLRAKIRDLRRRPAFARQRPLGATALYVGEPGSDAKSRYRTRELDETIRGGGRFDPAHLAAFLKRIGASERGM